MPYRVRPDHPLGREARRVAKKQLEKARHLLDTQPDGLHAAIHEARKAIKRVRALYRLTAVEQKRFRKTENARLRNLARSLSSLRDAAAFIETLMTLCEKALNDDERRAVNMARQALAQRRDKAVEERGDIAGLLSEATADFDAAIIALDDLDPGKGAKTSARQLAAGWHNTLTSARRALDVCSASSDPEAFHDLRKAAQTYWRHLTLVRQAWPSAIAGKRAMAKQLAALLGRDHDIVLLVALLDRDPQLLHDEQTLSHLLGLLAREQQTLRRESLCLADRLFADSPDDEAQIIARLWRTAASR